MTQRGCLIYDKFIDRDPYYRCLTGACLCAYALCNKWRRERGERRCLARCLPPASRCPPQLLRVLVYQDEPKLLFVCWSNKTKPMLT